MAENTERKGVSQNKTVDQMLNDGKFLEFLSRVKETGRDVEVTDENTAEVQEMYHVYSESKKAAQLFAEVAHADFKQTLGAEVDVQEIRSASEAYLEKLAIENPARFMELVENQKKYKELLEETKKLKIKALQLIHKSKLPEKVTFADHARKLQHQEQKINTANSFFASIFKRSSKKQAQTSLAQEGVREDQYYERLAVISEQMPVLREGAQGEAQLNALREQMASIKHDLSEETEFFAAIHGLAEKKLREEMGRLLTSGKADDIDKASLYVTRAEQAEEDFALEYLSEIEFPNGTRANKEQIREVIEEKIETLVAKECEKLIEGENTEGLLRKMEKVLNRHVFSGSGTVKNEKLRNFLIETFQGVVAKTVPSDKGRDLVLKRLIYKLEKI